MKEKWFNIIAPFPPVIYIKISTKYGVASLQFPVKYPQLPANPIG